MIGSLRGTLLDRDTAGSVLVEAAGVGYQVAVTGPTSAALGELGSGVFLYVHTRVREDAISLFGFASAEERRCFEALVAAHGVGPSMAMALLTMHTPVALRQIVALEDADALSRVPGIGKKTAARLLMELKAKFEVDLDEELVQITSTTSVGGHEGSARADVAAALEGLGYAGDEIRRILSTLSDEGGAEQMLRTALRELAAANR
jgi:holliday junction DNA helicase RuvA